MGPEITQHPEQFRAVVSLGGIYDMLRVELAPKTFADAGHGSSSSADLQQ